MKKDVSVVLTCHNRKEKTIGCLTDILQADSVKSGKYEINIYACDDASSDSTADAISQLSDKIHIVSGNGDLFWARGMAKAMAEAEKSNADFYLMVNDDVEFFPDMLDVMLDSYYSVEGKPHAVVGSTKDKKTGKHTYGGLIWNGKGIGEERTVVTPCTPCPKCNQTNWNCFLLPKALYDTIGKIDDYYEHSWADFDYSNRIISAGYDIYVAHSYIGFCSRNEIKGTWIDRSLSFGKRIRAMHKKTGLPPRSHWHYCRKFYGSEAVAVFLRPYLSIIKSSVIRKRE